MSQRRRRHCHCQKKKKREGDGARSKKRKQRNDSFISLLSVCLFFFILPSEGVKGWINFGFGKKKRGVGVGGLSNNILAWRESEGLLKASNVNVRKKKTQMIFICVALSCQLVKELMTFKYLISSFFFPSNLCDKSQTPFPHFLPNLTSFLPLFFPVIFSSTFIPPPHPLRLSSPSSSFPALCRLINCRLI